jgi:hypothetical protein
MENQERAYQAGTKRPWPAKQQLGTDEGAGPDPEKTIGKKIHPKIK